MTPGNSVFIYRLYDVASEINLATAEKILAQSIIVSRMQLTRVSPKTIIFTDAPVAADLVPQQLTIAGHDFTAEVGAHIYALGIVSIILKIKLPDDLTNENAIKYAKEIEEIAEQPFLTALDTVLKTIQQAILGEYDISDSEDLTVFYFKSWQDGWDPVPLLLAENKPVSAETRRETLANRFSYGKDFAILTWDTAIVYEPSGSLDIPDLLEFANAQLLKLSCYDDILNREIEKLYDSIAEANKRVFFRKLGKFRNLRWKIFELMADITLITGKIRNSLLITEDVFYARVYTSYLKVLHEDDLEASISQKTEVIQNSYNMLNDEVVTHRAELMEFAIIVLIALELIVASLK